MWGGSILRRKFLMEPNYESCPAENNKDNQLLNMRSEDSIGYYEVEVDIVEVDIVEVDIVEVDIVEVDIVEVDIVEVDIVEVDSCKCFAVFEDICSVGMTLDMVKGGR